MNNEILDDNNQDDSKDAMLADKSFNLFMIGSSLIGIFYLYDIITGGANKYSILGSLIIGAGLHLISYITSFIGLRYGYKVLQEKENSSWKKYVGFGGNLLIFLYISFIISGVLIFVVLAMTDAKIFGQ